MCRRASRKSLKLSHFVKTVANLPSVSIFPNSILTALLNFIGLFFPQFYSVLFQLFFTGVNLYLFINFLSIKIIVVSQLIHKLRCLKDQQGIFLTNQERRFEV